MKWGGVTTPFSFIEKRFRMIIKSSDGKVISLVKIVESSGEEKLLLQVSREDEYQVSLTFEQDEVSTIVGELTRLFQSTKKNTIQIKSNANGMESPIHCDTVTTKHNDAFYTRWKNLYSFNDSIPLTN